MGLWSILCTINIMFYYSNLRANLTAKAMETPIDSVQDALRSDRNIFVDEAFKEMK